MDHQQQPETPEAKTLGVLAEFPGPDELVEAAAKTTAEGYRRVEAFSPFPIHGIDDALRHKKTILPWLVFCCGLTGCIVAQVMQHYTNGIEGWWPFSGYQYSISAKPFISVPSSIPVTFELIVLLSAFGAFFGMWALNGLPRLSNPLFKHERFATATSHGFFLWIDAKDKKFSEGEAASYLKSIGSTAVDPVQEELEGREVPGLLWSIGVVGATIALVPPLWLAAAAGESSQPRLSIWWCMDYQPKFKPQTATDGLFADGRSMRKPVEGTVPRGGMRADLRYYQGIEGPAKEGMANANPDGVQFVHLLADEEAAKEEPGEAVLPPEPEWVTAFPEQFEITAEVMDRGQERFNIYCATCHGLDGEGQGLVTRRGLQINELTNNATWSLPTSLRSKAVADQPVGRLFDTITNGRNRMPGYSQQITVEDRWAIVLYMRAMQRQEVEKTAAEPVEAE